MAQRFARDHLELIIAKAKYRAGEISQEYFMKKFIEFRPLAIVFFLASLFASCDKSPVTEEGGEVCSGIQIHSCQTNDRCNWVGDKCEPAEQSVRGTCKAIKQPYYCKGHKSSKTGEQCVWNSSTTTCEALVEQEIYVWKELTLPGKSKSNVKQLVVSKDKKNFYAYNDLTGEKGLYYSTNGENWTNLGQISAKVRNTAGIAGTYDSRILAPLELIPTSKGAVVASKDGVFILEGREAKWGIDRRVNSLAGSDPLADFWYQEIAFADVVLFNGIENVVFGQIDDSTTNDKIWAHKTEGDFNNEPKRIRIVKKNGTDFAQRKHWVRAGNTFDGDLLLAARTPPWLKTTGIWRISKVDIQSGRVAFDDPVLYPSPSGNWNNGTLNADDRNLNIKVIGSFDNGGVSEYFAGMDHDGWKSAKGLAHYKGEQGNAEAVLDFANDPVRGINLFNNILRVRSYSLLGVNVDGTPNLKNNYSLPSYSDLKEMTVDRKKIDIFIGSPDNIFGDDDLSFLYQQGKYLYSRTKTKGLPLNE